MTGPLGSLGEAGEGCMRMEKTLESPLDCKEIQPVHSKGDQSWVFFGKTDAKAETPVLWQARTLEWVAISFSRWRGHSTFRSPRVGKGRKKAELGTESP